MTDHFREHTDELPIVMFDEPGFPFAEFVCGVVWWIGSAVLVVLLFAALGMALGFVNFG